MEDNKAPKLWDDSVQTPKTLRLPKTAPTSEPLSKEEEPKSKSVLSADAPEWYPPNYQQQQPRPTSSTPNNMLSVQDRLKKFKISDNSHSDTQETRTSLFNEDLQEGYDYNSRVESPDILRLKQLINTLTCDPGQFNHLLEIFIDTLYPYYDDPLVLFTAAELLVNQAISNQNFRYTAARLCCYIEQQCPEFRATIHLRCKKELEKNSNKPGLLLFAAELYMQLHYENVYGSYLIDAFKQLLSEGGNENIKSICQALKLTGYSLEKYNKEALDDVFAQLDSVKSTTDGTALNLLNSVISLRASHWGQGTPTESLSDQSDQEGFTWGEPGATLYYDTDGYRLTTEESAFLAANIHSNDDCVLDNDSDPDELCDPEPEMDEEIQAAFKEFVKFSKR